jgi:hypothetical protein
MYLLNYIESVTCPCIIYSISLTTDFVYSAGFCVYNPLCKAAIDISPGAVSPVITLNGVMSF